MQRTTKRRWRRKYIRGRSGFAKAVKNVILKTAEKKFVTRDLKDAFRYNAVGDNMIAGTIDQFGQIACYHNNVFRINIVNNNSPDGTKHPIPSQGVTDQSRNGDEIYGTGFMLRMQIENDANKHNNTWKFWLVEYNTSQGEPGNPTQASFNNIGTLMLDTLQSDRFKFRALGTYRTKARDVADGLKTNIFIKKWIPFKRKLCFNSDSTIAVSKGMKEHLAIIGMCYDSSNTVYDTAAGNLRVNSTFYFKDP